MGAKCRHEHRHQDAEVRYSLGALVLCGQSTATRSYAAGSARGQRPGSRHSRQPRLRPRSSSVRLRRGFTWSLFRPASAGVNPAGSEPGAQDAAVPAAGADIVSLVPGCAVTQTAKDCAGTPASRS